MGQLLTDYWSLGVLGIVLVIAAATDVARGKVYNALTYPAAAIGLIGHSLVGGLWGDAHSVGLIGSLAGLAIGAGPMMLAMSAGGMRGGDMKLMGAVGALLGWKMTLSALLFSFVAAAVLAIGVIVYRRVFWRTFRRIGVFLLQLVSLHKPFDPASPDSPKVPFALAILLGSAGAVVEQLVLKGQWILGF